MALFFPKELTTTVDILGDDVVIVQFDDDECTRVVGQVSLTKHQFNEILNHSKSLLAGEV